MKKIILLAFAVILSSTFFNSLQGQTKFSFRLGAADALGSFGSVDTTDVYSVGAGLGATVGLKFSHKFKESGFSVFGSVDAILNGLSRAKKDAIRKTFSTYGYNLDGHVYPKFLNIPVSFGVEYQHTINENVSIMGSAGVLYNFAKITDGRVKPRNITYYSEEYGWSGRSGFRLGAGLLFKEKYSLTYDYFIIGENFFDLKTTIDDETIGETNYIINKTKIGTLSFGLMF